MHVCPLESLSVEQAKQLQYRVVDCITREFAGKEIISRGDLGVTQAYNKPITTLKAERVIATVFDAQASVFVRGAGTGAIRSALSAVLKPNDTLLVHTAPVYPTTMASVNMLGINLVRADFNSPHEIERTIECNPQIKAALIQYTRQTLDDSYNLGEVVASIKKYANISVITDDNYAVMKVQKIGVQYGADLSCFSCFKLLGPEGIGCVVGAKQQIETIVANNYSGGCQTQGHEALEALRGLTYAPVMLALQAETCNEIVKRINAGEVENVKNAFLANAQSKVVLVELTQANAEAVLKVAEKLGAAPNPVGAESKYEIAPMFYRVSGTFGEANPELKARMIRINPMRSGADTVIRILKTAIENSQI